MSDETTQDPAELAQDLVRFFRALPTSARRDYEALAALDRELGEDVDDDDGDGDGDGAEKP